MRKHNRGFDSTTFKVVGIVVIFILILFICDPARGADDYEELPYANTAINELLSKDYGIHNAKRNILVNDLDFVVALVAYTTARQSNFDDKNGLDTLDVRKIALSILLERTEHVYNSVVKEIIFFVKDHKGI